MKEDEISRQREYYQNTADQYDESHLKESEHELALAQLLGYLNHFEFESLLDIGCGTGRVLRHAKNMKQNIRVMGVEPVDALREIGYENGVAREDLVSGDATRLDFEDNSWDVVSAFGILHHIPDPNQAISEMCRVAKHAVFFSDLNSYGNGSFAQRAIAQSLRAMKLWRPFQWLKNGGRYDKFSEGDGVYYSYSLFDSLKEIQKKFPQTYICNTRGNAQNIYRGCSHASVMAVKSDEAKLFLAQE